MAIGDVVGHGIEAGAEAVRLRNALRVAVLGGHDVAGTVAVLNEHARREEGAFASTVLYLELEAAPAAPALGERRACPRHRRPRRPRRVAGDGGRAAARGRRGEELAGREADARAGYPARAVHRRPRRAPQRAARRRHRAARGDRCCRSADVEALANRP